MSGSTTTFPTSFTPGVPSRTSTVLGDDGTSNHAFVVSAILGLIVLTDLPASGATAGQVLSWSGTAWAPTSFVMNATQLATLLGSLPTTSPTTPGVAWLDNGVLALSQ